VLESWNAGVPVLESCWSAGVGELVLAYALAILTNDKTIERKYTIKMKLEPFFRTFVHIYTNIGSRVPEGR
jgi:hypothetical protein